MIIRGEIQDMDAVALDVPLGGSCMHFWMHIRRREAIPRFGSRQGMRQITEGVFLGVVFGRE